MNLRYHHIVQLLILEDSFARWKELDDIQSKFSKEKLEQTTFESLYNDVEMGTTYIKYFVSWQTERVVKAARRLARYEDLPSLDQVRDYVGNNGERANRFKEHLTNSLTNLLLSDPNTEILISYAPDDICSACQLKSKRERQFGRHCIDELYAIHDFQWDRAFADYIRYNSSPYTYIQRQQTPDGPIVISTIGLVRNHQFLAILEGHMDETMGGRFQEFLNYGVLEIVGSPGIVRATESYLRGEKEF